MFLWCPSYLRGLLCSFPSAPGNFEDNMWFNKPRPFNLDFIFLSYQHFVLLLLSFVHVPLLKIFILMPLNHLFLSAENRQ